MKKIRHWNSDTASQSDCGINYMVHYLTCLTLPCTSCKKFVLRYGSQQPLYELYLVVN